MQLILLCLKLTQFGKLIDILDKFISLLCKGLYFSPYFRHYLSSSQSDYCWHRPLCFTTKISGVLRRAAGSFRDRHAASGFYIITAAPAAQDPADFQSPSGAMLQNSLRFRSDNLHFVNTLSSQSPDIVCPELRNSHPKLIRLPQTAFSKHNVSLLENRSTDNRSCGFSSY